MIIKLGICCSLFLGALFSGVMKHSSDRFSTQENFSNVAPIPERIWERDLDSTVISTPIHTRDGNVIINTYLGSIYCLDALTGEEKSDPLIMNFTLLPLTVVSSGWLAMLVLLEPDVN